MPKYLCDNGLRAYTTTETFTRFSAGGRSWWAGNDDAAIVGAYLINRFNAEVEPVVFSNEEFDDWSWNFRPIRDQESGYSNHSGAWAWDVNATRHPRGVPISKNLSPGQIAKIRQICKDIDRMAGGDLVRWGGDYTTTVDGMHFEIVGSLSLLKRGADAIRQLQEDDMPSIEEILNAKLSKFSQSAAEHFGTTGKGVGYQPDLDEAISWAYISATEARRDASHAADTIDALVAKYNTDMTALNAKVDRLLAAFPQPPAPKPTPPAAKP